MSENSHPLIPEITRLLEDASRDRFWKLWGPYLSDRQWGTIREDYSENGNPWNYLPHDHARSRAYRWGEDGLLGICDRFGRLCFAITLWNEKDLILKERLFGLSGPEGNHGEDVKELYYYLDSTPTHSYCKALYKYPQAAFPYTRLVEENARRSREEREFEIIDTGIFDENRYFDVFVEYAKASIKDILIRVTICNRGPEAAPLHILPTLWYRNTWSWGELLEECIVPPVIHLASESQLLAHHEVLGDYVFSVDPRERLPEFLFTNNETNLQRLENQPNPQPYVKDAFHARLIEGCEHAVNPNFKGTKAAAHYRMEVPAGSEIILRFRLTQHADSPDSRFDESFEDIFQHRIAEADQFYETRIASSLSPEKKAVARQAYAGLLWSKQFYNLVQTEWMKGAPKSSPPPFAHTQRNAGWDNLFNRDVLSMPDKWEYPYYCTWDLAFHAVSLSRIDPPLSKQLLTLFLREWYMHPNGRIPAYEWNFSDVNPPVHAWAAWRVYRLPWLLPSEDRVFLESIFGKLLLNFTWWVNRKDPEGNDLFGGGFLGLDNVGVFDRSKPLPTGGTLKQADGTAWMAFYCIHMLSIALELAQQNQVYEDLASKFFEHFVRIVHAMHHFCGTGLWDEQDGFYYDLLQLDDRQVPLRVRSIIGFLPLLATTILPESKLLACPNFVKRVQWFIHNRSILTEHIDRGPADKNFQGDHFLAVVTKERLQRLLLYMFDEEEFLSPYGIRSVSKFHEKNPYIYWLQGVPYSVNYEPGEGTTGMFGGNSNWRGPIWLPLNYLLIEALRIFHQFYGDKFTVEFPTRSGNRITLGEAARLLTLRLMSLFLPDQDGNRPCHGGEPRYAQDPLWKELVLFYEYFHADTGRGCGASHQTGWTSLVTDLLNLSELTQK